MLEVMVFMVRKGGEIKLLRVKNVGIVRELERKRVVASHEEEDQKINFSIFFIFMCI